MNARRALGMTATVIALSGMAACGTHHAGGAGAPSHPQSPSSSASSSSGNNKAPLVIKVNAASDSYHMVVGQKLIVQVSSGTKIQPSKKACGSGNGDVLKQLCTSGQSYEYQALRSGTAQFSYTLRPDCEPGAACPAWIRNATFKVTVS
jgi:hypothetical protein